LLDSERERAGGVALLAGGTDLMVEISQSGPKPDPLPLVVDVSRLSELRRIDWDGTRLCIGAGVSYLEMQRHPVVVERAPVVAAMTLDVGGPTIQARGTLGGNFATASPAADGVAAVAAYDPVVIVQSVRGRRRIPMADLQTGYKTSSRASDEVIVAVELEPPPAGTPHLWRKVGTRAAQAISKVALAAVAELEQGMVRRFGLAMASVAPVTALMPHTRALLQGKSASAVTDGELDAAVERDVNPIDDIRSTRAYRVHCAKGAVRAFVRSLRRC
jgi:CO/xanthine dehydrogenase FAD-binding subunit